MTNIVSSHLAPSPVPSYCYTSMPSFHCAMTFTGIRPPRVERDCTVTVPPSDWGSEEENVVQDYSAVPGFDWREWAARPHPLE